MVQDKQLFRLKQIQFKLINLLSKLLYQKFKKLQLVQLGLNMIDKVLQVLQNMQIKNQTGVILSFSMSIKDHNQLCANKCKLEVKVLQ